MNPSNTNSLEVGPPNPNSKPVWVTLVCDQIQSLRFGTVMITVHEGRVVQVEKNEKLRLDEVSFNASRSNSRS
jgi:hypothetical protein